MVKYHTRGVRESTELASGLFSFCIAKAGHSVPTAVFQMKGNGKVVGGNFSKMSKPVEQTGFVRLPNPERVAPHP